MNGVDFFGRSCVAIVLEISVGPGLPRLNREGTLLLKAQRHLGFLLDPDQGAVTRC